MKRLLRFFTSRLMVTLYLILGQILLFTVLIWKFMHYFVFAYFFFLLLGFIVVLHLIRKEEPPSLKLPWMIIVILFPLFGGIFYVLFGQSYMTKKAQNRSLEIQKQMEPFLVQDENILKKLSIQDRNVYSQVYYFSNYLHFPMYQNTNIEYLKRGEVYFAKLVEILKKAQHFIFMEYFIVQEGTMWNTILTILEEKVKEGVEVRFMYDDLGCIGTLPNQYYKILRQKGIQCIPFHPFVPIATILHNNRDHRKITVVDGYMGFTGGVNLADEYINVYEKHGHWKDSGVYLEGEAVRTLTMLFLESWDKHSGTNTKYKYYLPHTYHSASFSGTGYVIPYGDTPLDQELVGETVYLNLIHQATSYIYINTPYFIVDYEFVLALSIAAKKGVDVRICTPHIPDKWYVHMVTQSYYEALLEAGVKIYEYNPGFLHAKSIVVDDLYGVVGTINMDFRSFCHHYECAVWFYQSDCIESLKKDYLETLKVCVRIDLADCQKMPWYKRWLQSVLRFFGPLM